MRRVTLGLVTALVMAGNTHRSSDGLTPEQVRSIAFAKPPLGRRGYSASEVDMFLDLVEAALRNPTGHILGAEQICGVAFSKPSLGGRGYDVTEVDAFLDRVEEHLRSEQGEPADEAVGPSSHSPVRCALREVFNRRTLWRNALRLDFTGSRPALAIDLRDTSIEVTDLTTHALIASGPRTAVTVTPKVHTVRDDLGFKLMSPWPVLVVDVPGLHPLTIGPFPLGFEDHPDMIRRGRYGRQASSWRVVVPEAKYPTHVVTNADWHLLVDRLGLSAQLDSR